MELSDQLRGVRAWRLGATAALAGVALATAPAHAVMHWIVTAEEGSSEVPLAEIPFSCGFPILDSPEFWVLYLQTYPDCELGGHDAAFSAILREDGPPLPVFEGNLTKTFGQSMTSRYCPPCCCDPDCTPPSLVASVTLHLDYNRTRSFQWQIGLDVSAGGQVGIPLVAQGEVEATLAGQYGQGGSMSFVGSATKTVPEPICSWVEAVLTALVWKDAEYEMFHSYR